MGGSRCSVGLGGFEVPVLEQQQPLERSRCWAVLVRSEVPVLEQQQSVERSRSVVLVTTEAAFLEQQWTVVHSRLFVLATSEAQVLEQHQSVERLIPSVLQVPVQSQEELRRMEQPEAGLLVPSLPLGKMSMVLFLPLGRLER